MIGPLSGPKTQLASKEPFSKEASYGKRRKVILYMQLPCQAKYFASFHPSGKIKPLFLRNQIQDQAVFKILYCTSPNRC